MQIRNGLTWVGVWILATIIAPVRAVVAEDAPKTIVADSVYTATLVMGDVPHIVVSSAGKSFFRLPIVAGITSGEDAEKLTEVVVAPIEEKRNVKTLTATASSLLWHTRRFVWKFFPDHIEFQQFASGDPSVGRVYFFSNGVSG